MARYLLLRFEHDDEFGMFPDDLEIMLEEISNPPYSVRIVGEAIPKPLSAVADLYKIIGLPGDKNTGGL